MTKRFLLVLVLFVSLMIPAVCAAEDGSTASEGDVYRVSWDVEIIAPMPAPEPEPEDQDDSISEDDVDIVSSGIEALHPVPAPMPEPEDQDDSISEGDVYRVSWDVEIIAPMPAPEPEPEPAKPIIMVESLPRPETPKMWSNQELTVFCELNNGTITVWTDGIESPRLFVFDITSCHVEVLEPSGDGGVPTFRLKKSRGILFLAVFDDNGTIFKITI